MDRPPTEPAESLGTILLVDDDRDISAVVEAVLTDEGFRVSCLATAGEEALHAAVNRVEPDCVLLDSAGPADYGASWELARQLRMRERPVPVIMFTAHRRATEEAEENVSERSRAAGFSAVVPKPFQLEDLLAAVARAVGQGVAFDPSPQGDLARTQGLVERLCQGGAADIRPSARREWVSLRAPSGSLVQLYWWESRRLYLVGRYSADGAAMEPLGEFANRDAAIARALMG
jgi:CheY-like chemotaxis protein